jgi:superfamily II DNA or RNA helicase
MDFSITRKKLADWGGPDALAAAESIVAKGMVLEAEIESPWIRGSVVRGNRAMDVSLRIISDTLVENHCPCYDNQERGLVCAHALALGLVLVKRATDPLRDAKYQEERRRAERLASFKEEAYLGRAAPHTPGAIPASLHIRLSKDWQTTAPGGSIPMQCSVETSAGLCAIDVVPRDAVLSFTKTDESLLYVIEDICEGPARAALDVRPADFVNILQLLVNRELSTHDGSPIRVNATPMQTALSVDLDRETGELILIAHTELPFMKGPEFPFHIVPGRTGWVYGAGNFWPLDNVLPGPYRAIYDEPAIIQRPDVVRFLKQELDGLRQFAAVETDLTVDLFTIEPAAPCFRLVLRGSPVSLAGTLYAAYDGVELVAGKPDAREHFALPDPEDLMRYTVRNTAAERQALERLQQTGLAGESGDNLRPVVGRREVLNFLAVHRPALHRWGWHIDFEGKVTDVIDESDFVVPVVNVHGHEEEGWFDVSFAFEADGASISPADIQRALRKGDAFIEHRGRMLLIDSQAMDAMMDVFQDCASGDGEQPGHFRMSDCYSAFIKASLEALDGVDIEADTSWRARAEAANRSLRIEPVDLPPPLDTTLRPYQKDGVNWLRFLERSGFCGILADEMGLGKTLQTLCWIQLQRHAPEARGKPVLIVCPSSLVENWAEEARRFVPGLGIMTMTGSQRHDHWDTISCHDILVTSYALLRRDLDRYVQILFAATVLDEAQHIKNRSTQNAKAAKKLRALHRLVLTGTPIENSVADLWSIMDFLMPGYLGPHTVFRQKYELPISHPGEAGIAAQTKLRRKLRPFLLRRMKREVARELPDKIERVSLCTLTPDQAAVYRELLNQSRRKVNDLVAARGFQGARMEILTTLLRLRQACCHLDLLNLPDLKPEQPSAKLDLCFELLDEAIDSGHRVLIFSQFVSMLQILRKTFEDRGWDYCYLDGGTKDRLAIVHRFNTQRDIPAFLISLKAGGTGLNLTGADMVIHFDPWWNPAVENQATDRAHRIGQRRSVYSVKLITRGTVEEKVLEMQQRKQSIIDATVAASDERIAQGITWDDVQELLTI